MTFILYATAILLGFILQIVGNKGRILEIISLLGIFGAYIFSIIIQNSAIVIPLAEKLKISSSTLIVTGILLYSSNTFWFVVQEKVFNYRIRRRVKISDEFVMDGITKILNNLYDEYKRVQYKKLIGQEFCLSLFFVKGKYFKKVYRIASVGHTKQTMANWKGIISKLEHSSTGRVVLSKQYEIVDFRKVSNLSFKGIPQGLFKWSKENITYRITIPCYELENNIIIVMAINCFDKKLNWKTPNLDDEKKEILEKFIKAAILKSEDLFYFYEYCNTMKP